MRRLWIAAAASVAMIAAPAFAQSAAPSMDATAPSPSTTAPTATPQAGVPAASAYTDAQLRSYITASTSIQALLRTSTAEQASAQIDAVLQQNNLDRTTYNGISAKMRADSTFAQRVNTLRQSAG